MTIQPKDKATLSAEAVSLSRKVLNGQSVKDAYRHALSLAHKVSALTPAATAKSLRTLPDDELAYIVVMAGAAVTLAAIVVSLHGNNEEAQYDTELVESLPINPKAN